ncbi:MAG: hypothetical protein KDD99_00965 [Bacteroidetes bacterium]|nr:hypothetical protein [Bacteroidota bacterium]
MPIEIRELTIRTEIQTSNADSKTSLAREDLAQLRKQLLEEVKKMMLDQKRKKTYRR